MVMFLKVWTVFGILTTMNVRLCRKYNSINRLVNIGDENNMIENVFPVTNSLKMLLI